MEHKRKGAGGVISVLFVICLGFRCKESWKALFSEPYFLLPTVSNIICVNFVVQLSLVENGLQASTVKVLQVLLGCFSSCTRASFSHIC